MVNTHSGQLLLEENPSVEGKGQPTESTSELTRHAHQVVIVLAAA
jgi:hypothetical protein